MNYKGLKAGKWDIRVGNHHILCPNKMDASVGFKMKKLTSSIDDRLINITDINKLQFKNKESDSG